MTALDAPVRPNPGSPDAIAQGCTCSRADNCHGQLRSPLGWWLAGDCPLHARPWKRTL